MKRIFAVLLAVIMVLSLAACGEEKRSSKRNRKDKEKTTGVVETTPVETEPVDTPVIPTNPGNQVVKGEAIFNTSDYSLDVTGVDLNDSFYGIKINLTAENKTSDKDYTIMLESFIVNGLDAEGVCYIDVKAGNSVEDKACLTREDLEMAGIDTVKGFKATFYIIDEEYKTLETKTYSYGEDVKYTRADQSTDRVIIDKDGVKVVLVSQGFIDDLDYKMIYYVENNTNTEIYVDTENATINDSDEMLFLGVNLAPGARTYKDINVYDFEFEELGIKSAAEVREIKFDLEVTDWEKFDVISTTPVTVNP